MGVLCGLAAACGGDDGGDGGGGGGSGGWGCDKIAASNACISYSGSQWNGSQKATYENACTNDGGAVVAACPSAGVVGRCKSFAGTPGETTQIYYTGANVTTAEQVCTSTGGSWST